MTCISEVFYRTGWTNALHFPLTSEIQDLPVQFINLGHIYKKISLIEMYRIYAWQIMTSWTVLYLMT